MSELHENLRKMVEGFRMAEHKEWDLLREAGPDPAWSIAVSLSMIAAAPSVSRPSDAADTERVRKAWATLRAGLTR